MYESTYEFTNHGDEVIEVLLEPFGRQYWVSPQSSLQVRAEGKVPGELDVELSAGLAVVYTWATSTAKVYMASILIDDVNIPVPTIPEGTSIRDFMHIMFGGPGFQVNGERDEV